MNTATATRTRRAAKTVSLAACLKGVDKALLQEPVVVPLSQAIGKDGAKIKRSDSQESGATVNVYNDKRVILSQDCSQVYGVVGPRYKVVPHKEVLERMVGYLGAGPTNVITLKAGASMRALWEVKGWDSFDVFKKDKIKPMIDVRNSVDGRGGFSVGLFAIRFACDNGMVLGSKIFGFNACHYEKSLAEDQLDAAMSNSDESFNRIARTFASWSKIDVDQDRMDQISESICFGKKKMREIGDLSGKSVWDAYNAFTNMATHKSRDKVAALNLSDRVGRAFFNEFPIAA